MVYMIDPGADVLDEVRAIAHDQVGKAIADLTEPGDDVVEAVHDCRKRCKKLRGLVRLVRPSLGDHYDIANATFRDAARQLSPMRDAHALRETFDALIEARRSHMPRSGLALVRDELTHRAHRATERADPDGPAVASALELLRRGEAQIEDWTLDDDGFDAIAGGLHKTYKRGRKALATVIEAPTSENLHEYRKRAKYSWYHVRLLSRTAPSITGPLQRRLHDLSDALGDSHDLAVLADWLQADPDAFGGVDQVDAALLLIEGQRADLERRAIRLGARLHAESPSSFTDRFGAYWSAWHSQGAELRAGEIADLS